MMCVRTKAYRESENQIAMIHVDTCLSGTMTKPFQKEFSLIGEDPNPILGLRDIWLYSFVDKIAQTKHQLLPVFVGKGLHFQKK